MNKEIKPWIILNEENVSPSPWFPILKHKVQLANGNIVDDYYFSPLGDVVQVLAVTKNNEVVLVKQYKHALGEILLELPGGMQQKDKSILESAINELEEETGIKAPADKLISLGKIANNPTKLKQITYGFIYFDAEFNSEQRLDTTEDIQVITIPAPEVLKKAIDGEIWVTDSLNFILKAALRYPQIFGLKL
ncbi:NUDIX hydrolase [Mucilaginibacter limnophilus]|uniref:GDP-mannose pyrophosphatase n=1 Tax=Mucilaginibacter limnophilus TaxID=1932778 RepID=A0A3S2V3T0_9SPHI|nr:NUDIX hydrolase [Mucilaginibacter limnophilus]RVU02641.1 NUDIX hydrolase [Mucilaginibacter limnophilus]